MESYSLPDEIRDVRQQVSSSHDEFLLVIGTAKGPIYPGMTYQYRKSPHLVLWHGSNFDSQKGRTRVSLWELQGINELRLTAASCWCPAGNCGH
ncbi:hypothetical protein RRG08_004754 [Elysia crispata]|uniref:Uncharacterized protein n=1 Tax=Elysia crispata TaxID=231223 RepID=A0AAE1DZ93_9GAST|nr:hypothetical protein RRG08_004754 [Elysia crispata]